MNRLKRIVLFLAFTSLIFSCTSDSPSETGDGIDRSGNLRLTGSSGSDLLSDMKFTSMNIEIVYVEGFRPTDEAINILKNFLAARTFKPDGISVTLRSVESSGSSPFSEADITKVERDTRTAYNAGDEIAVWIYFADGEKENPEQNLVTLGSAFRNTSIIIYEKVIMDFASRNGTPDRATIEASTLTHEFGHLFGLVDLGTVPVSNHEDPDNQGHCVTDGCLMRAAIEFGSGVINVIEGSDVPDLDQACIDDLQSIGGK
ncbi:hypothetical protein [Christiangramia sabulilitoris]|uniref:Membrane metalloprotease n=1 Tax=Christiangramia sabulilitoris TaxID=2583991 RepID=A0A550I368_9FLAO|nr:hypothetical protein [Christiangramia sabulilitoris]TRO65427.1 hypothetical protein FGM01_08465 [Christiangramia sabulilitoris]